MVLVLLTGPTGSGKTALAVWMARQYGWALIPTLTTRSTRLQDLDTKETVPWASFGQLHSAYENYRFFSYDGEHYASPMDTCRAAAASDSTSIIDWVHPHPEHLGFLDGAAVGVVLLPSPDVLRSRLLAAARADRVQRALEEREQIAARRSAYVSPWTVLDADPPLALLADHLIRPT